MMDEQTRKNLSEALKRKWASGTRKPNPRSTYEKSSATHREMYRTGKRVPRGLTSEEAQRMQRMVDPEKVLEANRRNGLLKRGRLNPPGPSARGPDHWKSRYWKLKAPGGQIIEGWNLNELVRAHAHLFAPEDLNWNGRPTCRAAKGLRQLYETDERGHTYQHSWKGWMALLVSDVEPA